MARLLLLAYGRQTEYCRAVFAVLSAWAWQPRPTVAATIYTDQPGFFEPYLAGLPVEYHYLSESHLTELKGPLHFVHRVKAQLIAQAFLDYPTEELLFIDSDTFFLAAPDGLLHRLAQGIPFMHRHEYRLAEAAAIHAGFGQAHYPEKLLALLASRTFALGGQLVQFHAGQSSWNSGVLGLPRALAPLLPDILALVDELYASTGWFLCEQLAFSLALQASGPVQACNQLVYHYWGQPQKRLMDKRLLTQLTPDFAALPLPQRLSQVRQLVPQLRRQLALDQARQGALYAFRRGQVATGLKCAARALLSAPFDARFARELLLVLRRRVQLRNARAWAQPAA
ncbi:hypothetical protein GCM10027422_20570 [Hymenobacter arcticus]